MLTEQKQSAALLAAIKEYDANKWKVVGQKVSKPAKVIADSSHAIYQRLTGHRLASSMQRNILVGGSERHVSDFISAAASLMIPNFLWPFSLQ